MVNDRAVAYIRNKYGVLCAAAEGIDDVTKEKSARAKRTERAFSSRAIRDLEGQISFSDLNHWRHKCFFAR